MTRRTSRPEPGLDALQSAVCELRSQERARAARAALVARDLSEPGPPPPGRITGRSGRLRAGSVPAPRPDDSGQGPAAGSYALVVKAQAGDTEAFAELYDRYVEMVYRYVAHRVASRPQAEDLTSDTFLRALRGIGGFTWQGRDVGAWLVTIARNLIADHYKSSRYRLELTTDDIAGSSAAPVVDGPEGEVMAGLESAVLLAAVRRLGSDQQECISLRFLQGMSVAETAAVMGRNDASVKSLQYRAVKALSRLLPEGTDG